MVMLSCPRHGQFETYRALAGHAAISSLCPHCADVRNNAELKAKAERRNLQGRQTRMRELHTLAQVPRRYADTSLDDYAINNEGQRQAQAIVYAYAKTFLEQQEKGGNLIMVGRPRTGKTMLACAVANSIIREFLCTCTFGTVSDYCREVRSSFGASRRGGRTEKQIIQDLRTVDLAILDDIGASAEGAHDLKVLFDIVDGRWRDGRPTVVTSNLDLAEMRMHLGDRLMKRLEDNATVVAFNFDGFNGRQGTLL
ncbi:ATP-binding protein [Dyella marensis]|uniref:IstB-like ATP binding protein n=1 Tax=Dyella marensis TaxID=500610 RepID=A0A1I2A0G4_9GAMM|nr:MULTISPECIES: ATP-binding protein [Dyella]SFE37326.1 IstB-like ATP binding protein [Dyella marensis]